MPAHVESQALFVGYCWLAFAMVQVMREYEEGIDAQALFGIASEFNAKGFLLKKDELGEVTGVANASRNPRRARKYGDNVPADQSNFSRACIMSFAMVELLLHAIGQMNSVAFREDLGNKTFRRKLKHIVITCPSRPWCNLSKWLCALLFWMPLKV